MLVSFDLTFLITLQGVLLIHYKLVLTLEETEKQESTRLTWNIAETEVFQGKYISSAFLPNLTIVFSKTSQHNWAQNMVALACETNIDMLLSQAFVLFHICFLCNYFIAFKLK